MKLKALLAGAFIVLASTAAQAANNFLIQIDDKSEEGSITFKVFRNNVMTAMKTISVEGIDSPLFLGNRVAVVNTFDDQSNFVEPDTKALSDTTEVSGIKGDNRVKVSFHSDSPGTTLTPLENGGAHDETGDFQKFSTFTVSNGDTYTFEMASDINVPEPATWAMMIVGLAGLGAVMRTTRRKSGAALTAA